MTSCNSTLRRSTPLKRTKALAHKAAIKAGKKKYRQRIVLDEKPVFCSEEYLAAVRTLNCVSCGKWHAYTEAAHSNQLRFGKARGLKASDATAMALCKTAPGVAVGCHNLLDQGGKMAKEERNQFECKCICKTVLSLIDSGNLAGDESVMATIQYMPRDFESSALHLVSLIESGELKVVNKG